MNRITLAIGSMFGALWLSLAPAHAQLMIDEARFGVGWAQPEWLPFGNLETDQVLITGEVLFAPFDFDMREDRSPGFIREILTPRLHVGGILNVEGDGTSSIYTGFTWHHALGEVIFIETSFGFGVNNGETKQIRRSTRAGLGSRVLFRESIALGVNLTPDTTFLLQAAHQSHAALAGDDNHGLTNFSAKLGFKF